MPRYNPADIEPKWQKHWEQHATFATPELPSGEKLYVLDMFPYPSGSGLHVGHPEGYTATDIVCRFERMRGKSVLHPMGFDAFGLPAEEHAIATGVHPRVNTEQNIATFKRQLKSLGFSYDWSRELATTDVEYFRWTQWIFLVLFDTWYDAEQQKGRPIGELPIPPFIESLGESEVRNFQDHHRLAYQAEALVNWCPALGTVLANEEVIDGKSERGGHPVVRMPLRQWMLRITAYADRLENDLEQVDWSEGIKKLQRDWIGRSTGAYVDFFIGKTRPARSGVFPSETEFVQWKEGRRTAGFVTQHPDDVIRVYTTRPDTLFGATYLAIAPENADLMKLTTAENLSKVTEYCQAAARKSDLDRAELAKKKTGVPTGSHAINPANGERVPIWVADYVLGSYGSGAIMAVPAHDTRDWDFAKTFDLTIQQVVNLPETKPSTLRELFQKHLNRGEFLSIIYVKQNHSGDSSERILSDWNTKPGAKEWCEVVVADDGLFILCRGTGTLPIGLYGGWDFYPLDRAFVEDGTAINSGPYTGLSTPEFKAKITADLDAAGIGREAVNYKLRDWLFSRQRFWGEPFPILHELDDAGQPTGLIRAVDPAELPVDLPHLDDFKPHGRPEPPLAKAPDAWLFPVIDGKKYRRETNTMPQWAGSCWYYLRFIDPKNDQAFVDREKEKDWMPVDLYVGGAEHAVLHLLYSRFWHKVLFDRGYLSTAEPFKKLVNQGMILGEMEYTGYRGESGWVSAGEVQDDEEGHAVLKSTGEKLTSVRLSPEQILKKGEGFVLKERPEIRIESRAYKMSKSRGNVISPDKIVREYGADSLRLYEMFMGPLEQVKPWSMAGVSGVRGFLDRVWRLIVDDKAEKLVLNASVQQVEPTEEAARVLHKTIKQVTTDLTRMEFNTAIARMMEFTNYFTKQSVRPLSVMEQFVLLLSPFAPHIAEELWQLLGNHQTLAYEPWPSYDEALTKDAEIEIPVQILGKLRSKVTVPADSDQETIVTAAKADTRIAELLSGKEIVKTIVVPGKLVNFVVK